MTWGVGVGGGGFDERMHMVDSWHKSGSDPKQSACLHTCVP